MKKNVFFLLFFVLISNQVLFAQTTQYGRVVEMNTKGKTVPGVSVTVPSAHDSQPASSDVNGLFRLVFSDHHPGDVIRGLRINKYGYEVVNHHILHEGWTLTEKDTLKIVLAPEGTVQEARSRYYKYLEEAFLSRYDSTTSILNEQYAQQVITKENYNALIEKAADDLDLAFQNIDMYADQLARIDQDDLDIDLMLNTLVNYPAMPMSISDASVAIVMTDDFDFLFKGMDFIEVCAFFGDFYLSLEMNEEALHYYSLALQMCETLDGYEGASFTDQIKQLQSIIAKINK